MHLCSHWLDYGGHSSCCPTAGSVLGLREGCLFQHGQDPILTRYRWWWWQNELGALQLSMLKSSFEFHDPDRDVRDIWHLWQWEMSVKLGLGAILESEVREQNLLLAANLSFFFFDFILFYPGRLSRAIVPWLWLWFLLFLTLTSISCHGAGQLADL